MAKKPVLYPLRTATGTLLTRGFPMDPRPGERVDHPHHVGLWFNYGDVNGVDFWNNSTFLTAEQQKKMGTIHHRKIVRAMNGKEQGELVVTSDWVMPDGQPIMREETTYVFHSGPNNFRAIDRITKLTALDRKVVMRDNKEGVLGIRLARELEHPSDKPEVFTDAAGRPTSVAKLDNTGVVGKYTSSEGKTGDDVWGTRGRWAMPLIRD
ncbi:MAG: PmoA family protein [Pyrinomonadaceae bacterium]